ncbi:hypothetical protein Aperf_G00000088578 [Anoplocephala perfoliata]
MALRQRRSPTRRLFQDVGNTLADTEPSLDEILDSISKLQISQFRRKYQFDLNTMQPCISETDLRENKPDNEGTIRCWSWEAVNAELVPAFYRPCIARSRKAERNLSQSHMPHPQSSVKSPKKLKDSPTMNTIFRTVKRSSSLGSHADQRESRKSRSQSLIQTRKAISDANSTSSSKRDGKVESERRN